MGLFNKIKNVFKGKEEVVKYDEGLVKTRKEFTTEISNLSKRYKNIDDDYFEELENILIMADIGANTVMKFVDKLKKRVKEEKITDSNALKEIIVDELLIMYVEGNTFSSKINYSEEGPTVILFIGVNGVGKTTSIGKIAKRLKDSGKKVIMVAADTFRAGAIEQLEDWGMKVDVPVVTTNSKDPSAAVYDGVDTAIKGEYDVVLIDTAGRLQNKVNLMNELGKINNVIKKLVPCAPHDTLLVVDATTGQNGISQAKAFNEVTDITGIVLTKLDGTAKGGIVLAIKEETGIPVKYVGLGEGVEDLEPFDIEKYIYGIFKDL